MAHRITITIDEKIEGKIRNIQAERIDATKRAMSFSQVLNDLLKKALENTEAPFYRQY